MSAAEISRAMRDALARGDDAAARVYYQALTILRTASN